MDLIDRFLKYVSFTTTSDENTEFTPSTPGQMTFAKYLVEELNTIGLSEVTIDENGYVFATLPSTTDEELPTIGLIAHMDTSPDFSAKHVNHRIVRNYDGKDIILDEKENILLSTTQFPELKQYKGQDIIVTDGHTLLGADDKAGIAEIISAAEYLLAHPEIKHGKIRLGFNPDEEIGKGAHKFDVEKFGAEWAYTIDGGEIGELEYENFNAAAAKITFKGCNIHPGYAYHKMLNSTYVAMQFAALLPHTETPEETQEYEGFYHLVDMKGGVEESSLTYIIRDHNRQLFENRKQIVKNCVEQINEKFGQNTASCKINDQYYNMREKVEPLMHIIDLAKIAMQKADLTPKVLPIRGGTDGAQLSFKNLPCPNIFTGGHNFHGKFEYIPVQSMEKAMQVCINIMTNVKSK